MPTATARGFSNTIGSAWLEPTDRFASRLKTENFRLAREGPIIKKSGVELCKKEKSHKVSRETFLVGLCRCPVLVAARRDRVWQLFLKYRGLCEDELSPSVIVISPSGLVSPPRVGSKYINVKETKFRCFHRSAKQVVNPVFFFVKIVALHFNRELLLFRTEETAQRNFWHHIGASARQEDSFDNTVIWNLIAVQIIEVHADFFVIAHDQVDTAGPWHNLPFDDDVANAGAEDYKQH